MDIRRKSTLKGAPETMRVMQNVIMDPNLLREFNEELNVAPGSPDHFWVEGDLPDLDETSDAEDPEKTAKDDLKAYEKEMTDKETLLPDGRGRDGTERH